MWRREFVDGSSPAREDSPTNPPRNHLLGFLRARPRAVGDAFRTNPRQKSRRQARLSWQKGDQSRTVKARLIDISRMGAAVSTTNPPPVGASICIRLVGLASTPWIEATVIGIEPSDGLYRVRIKFRDPCPTVMLKSAVLEPGAPSPHETAQPAGDERD